MDREGWTGQGGQSIKCVVECQALVLDGHSGMAGGGIGGDSKPREPHNGGGDDGGGWDSLAKRWTMHCPAGCH